MARNISLAEAKAKLSECIREAERGEPVVITRYGKPWQRSSGPRRSSVSTGSGPPDPAPASPGWRADGRARKKLADAVERRIRDRRPRQDD